MVEDLITPGLPQEKSDYFSSSTGLTACVCIFDHDPAFSINGEKILSQEKPYTRVDFEPEGRFDFDATKRTESLAAFMKGIDELLIAVDNGSVQLEPTFYGSTNIHMALTAQRFGFTIVDQCRTPDGNINKNLSKFTLIGNIDEIRSRMAELKEKGKVDMVMKRLQEQLTTP